MSSRASDVRRARLPRLASWLLDVTTANAGGAVYGAVMVGVLLAAEDARHEGYPATLEAAAIVLLLYLAHESLYHMRSAPACSDATR